MALQIKPETEAKLNQLATRTHRASDELLAEAVDYLVVYNDWLERKVKDSMAAADRGQVVSNEDVGAWLERREQR